MAADHVIVKGTYYSESIDAVYGPYTKYHAEWLATELGTVECWTVIKLTDLSQPAAALAAEAKSAQREINCTAAVTQVRPNHDMDRRAQRPIGFGLPPPC